MTHPNLPKPYSEIAMYAAIAFGVALVPYVIHAKAASRRVDAARGDVSFFAEAWTLYTRDHGRPPAAVAALAPTAPTVDPWGRPYLVVHCDGGLCAGTLGADGKPGGTGEDADLWEPIGTDAR